MNQTTMDDSASPLPKLVQLAATINTSIAKIQEVLDSLGGPSPSFAEDAPPLPPGISEARDAVLDATAELHDLLTEPLTMIHRAARVGNYLPNASNTPKTQGNQSNSPSANG